MRVCGATLASESKPPPIDTFRSSYGSRSSSSSVTISSVAESRPAGSTIESPGSTKSSSTVTSPEIVIGISRSAVGATSAVTVTTTGRPSSTTTAMALNEMVGTGALAADTASTTRAAMVMTATAWPPWSPIVPPSAGPIRTDTALMAPTV